MIIEVTINGGDYIFATKGCYDDEVDVLVGDLVLHFPNKTMIEDLRNSLDAVLGQRVA